MDYLTQTIVSGLTSSDYFFIKEHNMSNEAGKGSSPRPFSVAHEEFSTNWDRIFSGKPKQKFIREDRYIVFKKSDILNCLTEDEANTIEGIIKKVDTYRKSVGKDRLKTVVVESDWDMYEAVWKLVENS